jgi:hypothetical protein
MERLLKEELVAFLVVSSQYLLGGTEEKPLKPKQNTM